MNDGTYYLIIDQQLTILMFPLILQYDLLDKKRWFDEFKVTIHHFAQNCPKSGVFAQNAKVVVYNSIFGR